MSIEDAARATKIRPRQIADLEGDEYSNFANLAYARGFFVGYAKFLRVDVQPYLEAFEDTSTFGLDDYQYLSEVPVGMYRAPFRPLRRRRRKRTLLTTAMTLVAVAMALTAWYFVVSYRRLGDLDKLAARQEARERGSETAAAPTRPAGRKPPRPRRMASCPPQCRLPAIETIPVSVPAPGSTAPSPVPANDKTITSPAALAAAEKRHGGAGRRARGPSGERCRYTRCTVARRWDRRARLDPRPGPPRYAGRRARRIKRP